MVSIPAAFGSLRRSLSLAPDNRQAQELRLRAERIRELQQQALEEARKDPGGDGGRITLLDYYKAADTIIQRENQRLAQVGAPREALLKLSYLVDFRGQKLEGIEFRREHLTELEKLYNQHNFTPGAFDEVERGLAFNRAELANVTFIPATALEALGVDRGSHVRLENATFDGMKHGEVLIIKASPDGTPHRDIHFRNIQGGTLALEEGAMVKDVHAQGAVMHITMGDRSQLTNLHTDHATRIISIAAAPGAVIEGARLTGTTIAPGSSLAGTTWRDVELNEVNLKDVDFSGAELRGVTINGKPATFATLQAAGVAEGQLPASIDGSQREAIAPHTPQQSAMAAARGLLASGACVTGDAPDGNNPNQALPVTEEALACKKIDNEAFTASIAALAARGTIA
jgi:uncharacterized protein YjbI with pentapeptide repeats